MGGPRNIYVARLISVIALLTVQGHNLFKVCISIFISIFLNEVHH